MKNSRSLSEHVIMSSRRLSLKELTTETQRLQSFLLCRAAERPARGTRGTLREAFRHSLTPRRGKGSQPRASPWVRQIGSIFANC